MKKENIQHQLPDFLLPFYEEAVIFSKNKIKDIDFSGSTYQIEVEDPTLKKTVWAFLQMDHKGNIKDSFCSCESNEDNSGCVHVAAAYLRIYNGTSLPLHQRYEKSLWNQLCVLYADRIGYDPISLIKQEKATYQYFSISGKKLFSISATNAATQEQLYKIMEDRPLETEETSLKFSNLSSHELQLWRSGRPSPSLRYELSFWNDLAKWMMLLQDTNTPYEITFQYSEIQIPNGIQIDFPSLTLFFYLSEANLPQLIPSLETVKSPLFVHSTIDTTISAIVYDQETGAMHIKTAGLKDKEKGKTEENLNLLKNGRAIGRWILIPGKGFYAKEEHPFFKQHVLYDEKITEILDKYPHLLQEHLTQYSFNSQSVKVSYQIFFDNDRNLHITAYLFEPGDLSQSYSKKYGDWVFLEDDGFYHLEKLYFDKTKIVTPASQVSDFINLHRSWLNTQEGFHTHLVSIETELTYRVNSLDQLIFHAKTEKIDETAEHYDFNGWIYVKDFGFYSKSASQVALPMQLDQPILSFDVPLFIRMNEDELSLIPNFFSPQSPVKETGLRLTVIEDEVVAILPEYELLPNYQDKNVVFFEDYTYVEGEGFSLLPLELRLPEKFHHPITIDKDQQRDFFLFELPSIQKYIKAIDVGLKKPTKISLVAKQVELIQSHHKEGYSFKMVYETDFGSIKLVDVKRAMNKEQRFLLSNAGLLDLEDECFNWLRQIPKQKIELQSNKITLSTMELIRLNTFQEISPPEKESKFFSDIERVLQEFKEFTNPEPPDLTDFCCSLRAYQKNGVDWLWFLYRHRLAGLLCDDMGLGKTHQAMALLAAVKNLHKAKKIDEKVFFLVICPTSVIYHWEDKLSEFLPDLHVHTYYGLERSIQGFSARGGLLLTSYGIWKRDAARLSQIPFEVAILDEVQIAKSHTSQVHTTLLNLKATMKLGLTGTPIENRLRELKALFDIVLPSYMPSESDYQTFFIKPIERESNQDRKQLLIRFIDPFVLRRKKEQVLDDLPEKTEEIAHCALLHDQSSLYHRVLHQSRSQLLQELQEESSPIPYIHIFTLLSHLKQICNHPAVYLKTPEKYKEYHSGKWELFLELLHEARESQQKVVVFSQYLNMIDIMEAYMKEHHIGYASIRGTTTDRAEQIRTFNKDPDCEVFIGSLHAAGLGIDLTAASVVIHYDRWWNAARENQATDRVHRIGQQRGVQVFKLVTKGTFEETIDRLISRKGQLMEEIVSTDDQGLIKRFDRRDLIELLQDVKEIKE